MTQRTKQVEIKLKTVIQDGSDIEESEVRATGKFFRKGKLDVLNFAEKIDDAEVTTLITIQENKVTIKRSGAVSMHQQFQLGKKTENVYKHPHGNIHMETTTHKIAYHELDHGRASVLELGYTVKLNGQIERKHKLKLEITEEDS